MGVARAFKRFSWRLEKIDFCVLVSSQFAKKKIGTLLIYPNQQKSTFFFAVFHLKNQKKRILALSPKNPLKRPGIIDFDQKNYNQDKSMEIEETFSDAKTTTFATKTSLRKRILKKNPLSRGRIYDLLNKTFFLPKFLSDAISINNLLKITHKKNVFAHPRPLIKTNKMVPKQNVQFLHRVYEEIIAEKFGLLSFHKGFANMTYYHKIISSVAPEIMEKLIAVSLPKDVVILDHDLELSLKTPTDTFRLGLKIRKGSIHLIREAQLKSKLDRLNQTTDLNFKIRTMEKENRKKILKLSDQAMFFFSKSKSQAQAFEKKREEFLKRDKCKIMYMDGDEKRRRSILYDQFFVHLHEVPNIDNFVETKLKQRISQKEVDMFFVKAEEEHKHELRFIETLKTINKDINVVKMFGFYSTFDFPQNIFGYFDIIRKVKLNCPVDVNDIPPVINYEVMYPITYKELCDVVIDCNFNRGVKTIIQTYKMAVHSEMPENLRLISLFCEKIITSSSSFLLFKDELELINTQFVFCMSFNTYKEEKRIALIDVFVKEIGTKQTVIQQCALFISQVAGLHDFTTIIPFLKGKELSLDEAMSFTRLLIPEPDSIFPFQTFFKLFVQQNYVFVDPNVSKSIYDNATHYDMPILLSNMKSTSPIIMKQEKRQKNIKNG